ncbi:MAG: hypothetical protein ABSF80_02690 [Chitinispirillaceae bacterium]|jgi:hypothetical protein
MKLLISILYVLSVLSCVAANPEHIQLGSDNKSSKYSNEIIIIGSTEFKRQITKALTLLCEKAPKEYQVVKTYIGKIEENERSGMFAYKNPPTYQMSLKTSNYSVTWCASTIAHDSFHSKLYLDYKRKYGEPVPDTIWIGIKAEKKCISFQIKVLRQIGAPQNEIDYSSSLDGTYYDVNKDGKYDWDDYKLRNW